MGVDTSDSRFYLDIIAQRVATKQNGCQWQQAYIKKHGYNFQTMLAQYLEYQQQELPIAEWRI